MIYTVNNSKIAEFITPCVLLFIYERNFQKCVYHGLGAEMVPPKKYAGLKRRQKDFIC